MVLTAEMVHWFFTTTADFVLGFGDLELVLEDILSPGATSWERGILKHLR